MHPWDLGLFGMVIGELKSRMGVLQANNLLKHTNNKAGAEQNLIIIYTYVLYTHTIVYKHKL